MTIKRIMHASDFSTASGAAFKLARALAKALHAELVLCHAYQPMPPVAGGEGYVSPRVIEQIWTAARTSAGGKLERLAAVARRDRLRVSTLLLQGAAAPAIVAAARRKRVGLLVLGTHGRTGVRRMLLGSVAERVVRTAHCPVLTVRSRV